MQVLHFYKMLVLFLLLFLLSCKGSNEQNIEGKPDAATEVKRTMSDYCGAIRTDGLLAELRFLDSSKDFFWVPPGYRFAIPYDSVAAAIKRNASLLKKVDNRIDSLVVYPLTDSLASFTERVLSTITDTAGKKNEFVFLETGIMVKRKEGWRFLSGQTTVIK